MKKHIAHCARVFWISTAILIVAVAVVVALARQFSPTLNDNKDFIAKQLAGVLNSRVEIGQLEAKWQGFTPSVRVMELDIYPLQIDEENPEPSLEVGDAAIEVDLLRSLLQFRMVISDIYLLNASVRAEQDKQGAWNIAGIKTTAQGNSSVIDDPMDIFLLADRVQVDDVQLQLKNYYGNEFDLNVSSIQFENADLFHRVSANVTMANKPVLDFVMEAEGDPRADGERDLNAYLKVQDLPVKDIQDLLLSTGWNVHSDELDSSNLALTAWLTSKRKGYYQVNGDLDLALVETFIKDDLSLPKQVSGQYYAEFSPPGTEQPVFLQLRDLAFVWPDAHLSKANVQLDYADDAWNIRADRLELAQVSSTYHSFGLEQPLLTSAVSGLNTRGSITNLMLTLPSDNPANFLLQANLEQVSVDSWRGAPALSNVNGYVESGAKDGFVLVEDSVGLGVNFPDLFARGLEFNSAKGAVGWQLRPQQNAIFVNSGLLQFSREQSKLSAKFRLYMPWREGSSPMDMSLALGLTNGHVSERDDYLPTVLDPALREWLQVGIKDGDISEAGFIFRGALNGAHLRSSVQVRLAVENGVVDYHSDWPKVEDITADVVVDNNRVKADVDKARIWNTTTRQTQMLLTSSQEQLDLELNAQLSGPGKDGMRFLRETPLRESVGDVFDEWVVQNSLTGNLTLQLPLSGNVEGGYQRLAMALAPGRLNLTELGLEFSDVSGDLVYDSKAGLSSRKLQGELWGESFSASIVSPLVTDDPYYPKRDIVASFSGVTDVAQLQKWLASPELEFGQGKAKVDGTLTVPAVSTGPSVLLDFHTDLVGISVDLPSPLTKQADLPVDLSINIPVYEERAEINISANNLLNAQINLAGDYVSSVGVAIGGEPKIQNHEIWLTGALPDGDFYEWLDVIERYEILAEQYPIDPQAPELNAVINLYIEQATLEDTVADQLRLLGWQESDHWRFDIDSQLVRGEVILPDDEDLPLQAKIDYVRLPEEEELADGEPYPDPLADVVLSDIPNADVTLDKFFIGQENYGSWQFKLRQTEHGVQASEVLGTVRGMAVIGLDGILDGEGAKLEWLNHGGIVTTSFQGRLLASDLREVLYLWEQPEVVETSKAVFDADVSWIGSPAMIDYVNFNGDIDVDIEYGRFLEGVEGGGDAFLRLVALFNFDSWARRLRLGLSDIVDSGLTFDQIDGKFVFDDHRLILPEPVVVKAPSSTLRYAGTFDLQNELLDTKLVATLPVGGNLTFLAAVAAGLPAAAGIWAVSKIFKKQVNKVASVSYHIHGDWENPQSEFERLFDNNPMRKKQKSKDSEQSPSDAIPLDPIGFDIADPTVPEPTIERLMPAPDATPDTTSDIIPNPTLESQDLAPNTYSDGGQAPATPVVDFGG